MWCCLYYISKYKLAFHFTEQLRSHFLYITTFYKTVAISCAGFLFTGKGIIVLLIVYVLHRYSNISFQQSTLLLSCQSYSHPHKQLYCDSFKMLLNSCNMYIAGKNTHFVYDAVRYYSIDGRWVNCECGLVWRVNCDCGLVLD